jgi:hypothetical protein
MLQGEHQNRAEGSNGIEHGGIDIGMKNFHGNAP